MLFHHVLCDYTVTLWVEGDGPDGLPIARTA